MYSLVFLINWALLYFSINLFFEMHIQTKEKNIVDSDEKNLYCIYLNKCPLLNKHRHPQTPSTPPPKKPFFVLAQHEKHQFCFKIRFKFYSLTDSYCLIMLCSCLLSHFVLFG